MKTAPGSYQEPDNQPRFRMRAIHFEPLIGWHAGHQIWLECGHVVQIFGALDLPDGAVLCMQCRDLEE